LLSLLIAGCSTALLSAQETVVVLVRHGEKVSEAADAELSPAGMQRAERLVQLLAPLQPAALFTSDRKRTQQTLAPLAKALGLPLQVRKAGEEAALAAHLLEAWKGRTTVVCGHSNTVGPLATALGFKGAFAEPKGFDRHWIVKINAQGLVSLEDRPQGFSAK
jgi:phosphohistidine phosphatase SixA